MKGKVAAGILDWMTEAVSAHFEGTSRAPTHLQRRLKHVALAAAARWRSVPWGYTEWLRIVRQVAAQVIDTYVALDMWASLHRQRRLKHILADPISQVVQGTAEWLALRAGMSVTGTNIHAIVNTPVSRYNAMMDKLCPRPRATSLQGEPPAIRHGKIFEAVVKDTWASLRGVDVLEMPVVRHRTHAFIGASPDGFVDPCKVPLHARNRYHGQLVEIKCPYSRVPAEKDIPISYLYQMQLQMAVTGIDRCVFLQFVVETLGTIPGGYAELSRSGGFLGSEDIAFGFFWYAGYSAADSVAGHTIFFTNPDDPSLADDVAAAVGEHPPGAPLIWWVLRRFCEEEVRHDPEFLPRLMPQLLEFHNELTTHRERGTLPVKPVSAKAVANVVYL